MLESPSVMHLLLIVSTISDYQKSYCFRVQSFTKHRKSVREKHIFGDTVRQFAANSGQFAERSANVRRTLAEFAEKILQTRVNLREFAGVRHPYCQIFGMSANPSRFIEE
jgi:hypothetical protein